MNNDNVLKKFIDRLAHLFKKTKPPENEMDVFGSTDFHLRKKTNVFSLVGGGILILLAVLAAGLVILNALGAFNSGFRFSDFLRSGETPREKTGEDLQHEALLKIEKERYEQVLREERLSPEERAAIPVLTEEERTSLEEERIQMIREEENRSSGGEPPQPVLSDEERLKLEEERRQMVLKEESGQTGGTAATGGGQSSSQDETDTPPEPTVFPEQGNAQPQDPVITPE